MKSKQNSFPALSPSVSKRVSRLGYLSIALIVFSGCFAMGLCLWNNDYIGLDLRPFLVDSPFLKEGVWQSIWLSLTKQAFPEAAYYPVFQVSLGIDLLLFKGIPFWSSLLNLFLHIANALLLFRMARFFFERDAKMSPGLSLAAATAGAVLFAVHPVNVEPVSWICGRKVLLSFLFSALGVLVLAKETVRWRGAVLGGFLYLLGACSNALVLGVPFVAYAYFFMVRGMSLRRALARTAPLWIVLLIAGSMRVFENREELTKYREPTRFSQELGATLAGEFEQALSLVYPANLSHLYGSSKPPSWTAESYLGIVLILVSAGLIAALWRAKNPRARAIGFAIAAYWLALSPTFLHHFPRADRHLYVPFVPLSFIAGIGFVALLSFLSSRAAPWVLGGTLLLALATPLALVSRHQGRIWQDNVRLFENAVKIAPENAKALGNLALHVMARRDLERAKELYFRALDADPAFPETYLNLAIIYDRQGNLDKAIEYYEKGIRLEDKKPDPHAFLAAALEKKGRQEEALRHWRRVLELEPQKSRPYVNLGRIAGRNKDLPSAKSYFEKALEIEPESARIYYEYAVILEDNGDAKSAIERYRQVVARDPKHAPAHNNLGAIYAKRGEIEPAIAEFEKAVALDPGLVRTRANLGFMLLKAGKKDQAIAQMRETLKGAVETNDQALANDMRRSLEALGVSVEERPGK